MEGTIETLNHLTRSLGISLKYEPTIAICRVANCGSRKACTRYGLTLVNLKRVLHRDPIWKFRVLDEGGTF